MRNDGWRSISMLDRLSLPTLNRALTIKERGNCAPVGVAELRGKHRKMRSLIKMQTETWRDYRSRLSYGVLRRISPRHREQHRLEKLVGPLNCWDELGRYQFNILTNSGLKPHHSILDTGCGPLTVGLRLISYLESGNYVGLHVRAAPLAEAYRLVFKHALALKNPTLIHSQTFGKEELLARSFDYIWMSQLSYHLDESQMEMLFEQAKARMRSGGVLLFDIIDPTAKLSSQASWSGFRFHLRPLDYYASLAKRAAFSMKERGRIVDY